MRDYKHELRLVLPFTTAVFHDLPSPQKMHIHFEPRIVDPSSESLESTIVGEGEYSACAARHALTRIIAKPASMFCRT